jgi:hypothetical protein
MTMAPAASATTNANICRIFISYLHFVDREVIHAPRHATDPLGRACAVRTPHKYLCSGEFPPPERKLKRGRTKPGISRETIYVCAARTFAAGRRAVLLGVTPNGP